MCSTSMYSSSFLLEWSKSKAVSTLHITLLLLEVLIPFSTEGVSRLLSAKYQEPLLHIEFVPSLWRITKIEKT